MLSPSAANAIKATVKARAKVAGMVLLHSQFTFVRIMRSFPHLRSISALIISFVPR
jgi:hypothetical protein